MFTGRLSCGAVSNEFCESQKRFLRYMNFGLIPWEFDFLLDFDQTYAIITRSKRPLKSFKIDFHMQIPWNNDWSDVI